MKSTDFKNLLKKLSTDPRVKAAIDAAKEEATKSSEFQATSALGLIGYLFKYSASFLGRKRAGKLSELTGNLVFLITISMILKRNLFDRPEVKEFFEQNWTGAKKHFSQFYTTCQKFVSERVDQVKKRRTAKS